MTPSPPDSPLADEELLSEYALSGSNEAFELLVSRHVHWVYSAAYRQVGNHAEAQDIAQVVFTALARKAGTLRTHKSIGGWLFVAVRYAVNDSVKMANRRRERERKAAELELTPEDPGEADWSLIGSHLDGALAALNRIDREVVVLRFLEQKEWAEVGRQLGLTENTARIRCARAIEKLRKCFLKQGVHITAFGLVNALTASAVTPVSASIVAEITSASLASAKSSTPVAEKPWAPSWKIGLAMLVGVGMLFLYLKLSNAPAVSTASSQSIRQVQQGIDLAIFFNRVPDLERLIYFENQEATNFTLVLRRFLQAEFEFRQEAANKLNLSQGLFPHTLSTLFDLQGTILTNDLSSATVVSNFPGGPPMRFMQVAGEWKWDLFHGWQSQDFKVKNDYLAGHAEALDQLASAIRNSHISDATTLTNLLVQALKQERRNFGK
ncbi:MAG: sigma-70 family RNA polymerase sigma factor [Verrucomicrobiota bacterium]|nr:sigma-70 family RNA polymerase sigma factor [Verrucomicrobiota bacterium]